MARQVFFTLVLLCFLAAFAVFHASRMAGMPFNWSPEFKKEFREIYFLEYYVLGGENESTPVVYAKVWASDEMECSACGARGSGEGTDGGRLELGRGETWLYASACGKEVALKLECTPRLNASSTGLNASLNASDAGANASGKLVLSLPNPLRLSPAANATKFAKAIPGELGEPSAVNALKETAQLERFEAAVDEAGFLEVSGTLAFRLPQPAKEKIEGRIPVSFALRGGNEGSGVGGSGGGSGEGGGKLADALYKVALAPGRGSSELAVKEKFAVPPGENFLQVWLGGRLLSEKKVGYKRPYPFASLVLVLFTAFLSLAFLAYFTRSESVKNALGVGPLGVGLLGFFFSLFVIEVFVLTLSFHLTALGFELVVPGVLFLAGCALALLLAKEKAKEKTKGKTGGKAGEEAGTKEWRKTKAEPGSVEPKGMLGMLTPLASTEGFKARKAAPFLAVFLVFVAAAGVFQNHYLWDVYYERQAELTLRHGSPYYFDELSYLGRPSTYPPIFFEFTAQVAGLLGARNYEEIRLPLHYTACALFFTAALWFFSKTYAAWTTRSRTRFNRQQLSRRRFRDMQFKYSLLAAFLFLSTWVITLMFATYTLHVFSYLFLFLALAFFPECQPESLPRPRASALSRASAPSREQSHASLARLALASLALALGFGAHPTVMLFFLVLVFLRLGFAPSRVEVWRVLLVAGIGVLVAAVFYAPVFASSGLPYSIVPQRWGYLLTYGFDGVEFEFHLLLPLLALAVAAGVARRGFRLPALLLAVLLAVNLFVSFRVNFLLALVFAAVFPLAFYGEVVEGWERRRLPRRKARRGLKWLRALPLALVVLAIAVTLALQLVVHFGTRDYCNWGALNEYCVNPMIYLREHASTNEVLAVDPLYGHITTFFAQRRVLADLYVEYADLGKFLAEDEFHQRSSAEPLKEFNVTLALVNEAKWPPRPSSGERLFGCVSSGEECAERIYDNGYAHLYRVA